MTKEMQLRTGMWIMRCSHCRGRARVVERELCGIRGITCACEDCGIATPLLILDRIQPETAMVRSPEDAIWESVEVWNRRAGRCPWLNEARARLRRFLCGLRRT